MVSAPSTAKVDAASSFDESGACCNVAVHVAQRTTVLNSMIVDMTSYGSFRIYDYPANTFLLLAWFTTQYDHESTFILNDRIYHNTQVSQRERMKETVKVVQRKRTKETVKVVAMSLVSCTLRHVMVNPPST